MSNGQQSAFPWVVLDSSGEGGLYFREMREGLTKRELFAAMAMQGLLADPTFTKLGAYARDFATDAVTFADALLSKLEEGEQ